MADAIRRYIIPASLGRYARWLLFAFVVSKIAYLITTFAEYSLLSAIEPGTAPSAIWQKDARAADAAQLIAAWVQFFVYIITGITVLRWIYRCNSNLHASGASMEFTPGWAVGWYFVPVATLWKPYEAMREIWLKSLHPGRSDAKPSALLPWWWTLWLISSISGSVSAILTRDAGHNIETLKFLLSISMISSLTRIPTALILAIIVSRISEAQTHHLGAAEVF